MIHNIVRTYKKIIIIIILLFSVLIFAYFGYRTNDNKTVNTDQWEKVETEQNGYRYSFKTDVLEGTMEFGLQGYTAEEETIPVVVTVDCRQKNFDGIIRISLPGSNGKGIAYQSAVNCKKGVTERQTIDIPHLGDAYCFVFELLDQFGTVQFSKTVDITGDEDLESTEETVIGVGVLSDAFSTLSYINHIHFETDNAMCVTHLVQLDQDNFPTDPVFLQSLRVIIIDSYNTELLNQVQRECLETWINEGGHLILGTGARGTEVLSQLKDSFGADCSGAEQTDISINDSDAYLSGLNVYYSDLQFINESIWEVSDWSSPTTLYTRNYGEGRVCIMKFSLTDNSFLQWMGRDQGVVNLFYDTLAESIDADYYSQTAGWYIKKAIYTFLNAQTPNTLYFGIFFIIYLCLVVLISYYFLKRIKKREYIWITIPATAVLFTALLMVRAIGSAKSTGDSISALSVRDQEKGKEEVYMLYQNEDGKGGSINLLSSFDSAEPVDYEYGQQSSNTGSVPAEYTVNYTINGIEIETEESVPGYSQLIKLTKKSDVSDQSESCFKVQIKGDYTKFRGSIENVSSCNYSRVLLIRGTQYTVLYNLKQGKTQKIKGNNVKTWSLANSSSYDYEENNEEGIFNNILFYLEQQYISEDNKLNQLLVIGITDEKEIALFSDERELANQVSVEVYRYKISTNESYNNYISDINRNCLSEDDENESLKQGILEQNQTEALYDFDEGSRIKMLIRNADSFSGMIFAYNYSTDKMETVLSKADDVIDAERIEDFLSPEGEMKLRYILSDDEVYGSAPIISLLYEDNQENTD